MAHFPIGIYSIPEISMVRARARGDEYVRFHSKQVWRAMRRSRGATSSVATAVC